MNADDKVGEYLERGPAGGDAEVPDGAVHVRQVLGSGSVWSDPSPAALDGVTVTVYSPSASAVNMHVAASESVPATQVFSVTVSGLTSML